MNNRFIIKCYFILICLLISCTNPKKPEEERDYGPLIEAALETSINFNSSGISKPSGIFVEIPKDFWTQEIKDENPIRVYSHNDNIALVLVETKRTERGLYIYVAFSSYLPQNDDEITYTIVIEDNVYNFIREK